MNVVKIEQYGDILRPEDLQEILRVGRTAVYRYLANGKIKSIKMGGKYLIPKQYLMEFIITECEKKGA